MIFFLTDIIYDIYITEINYLQYERSLKDSAINFTSTSIIVYEIHTC